MRTLFRKLWHNDEAFLTVVDECIAEAWREYCLVLRNPAVHITTLPMVFIIGGVGQKLLITMFCNELKHFVMFCVVL